MSYDPATVTFELSGDEAWALAQFVVRVGWRSPLPQRIRCCARPWPSYNRPCATKDTLRGKVFNCCFFACWRSVR